MTVNRDKNGRFTVGNPGGGRPKIPDDLRAQIRGVCPKAVDTLIELLDDKKSMIRLYAAQTLLDRGYGKPPQSQDISVDMSGSMDVMTQIRRVAMEMSNNGQRTNTDDTDDKKALLLKIAASLPKDILEDCLRVLANDKSEEMTNDR